MPGDRSARIDLNSSLIDFEDTSSQDEEPQPSGSGKNYQLEKEPTHAGNMESTGNNGQDALAALFRDNLICSIRKPNLPTFLRDRPDIWFFMVESEFKSCNVKNDDTKFNSTIRALDADTLKQITDILNNPPATDKYQFLKKELLKRVSDSREKQVHKLLTELTLADKKPSQLLREMRDLAAGAVNNDVLHQLWLDRMPINVRPFLIISSKLDLDAVAEMADRLLDTPGKIPVMATAIVERVDSSSVPTSYLEKKVDDLQKMLYTCMQEIRDLKKADRRSRSRQPRSRTPNPGDTCYYHKTFGVDAKKCHPSCRLWINKKGQGN